MRFEFATAGKILFGEGLAKETAGAAREMGRHALLITGSSPERFRALTDRLEAGGLSLTLFPMQGEPDIVRVQEGVQLARSAACDLVIALGGGSVLDAGKAIAALLNNDGDLMDYLEVVGGGRALSRPAAPLIAIPTTSGTGSEVTRNSVLASPEHRVKVSMRSPFLLPRLAIIDPELTYDLPPALTASTGLDALTQLIEPFVCSRASAMTDPFCLEGMNRAARSAGRAYADGRDKNARADMALASLLGGLALANSGLGVVHGFAAPIGGMFAAPHGAVCAALLASGMDGNIRALRARTPESESLSRYRKVASILTGNPDAAAEDGPAWIRNLCAELAIPPLRSYGMKTTDVLPVVEKAVCASSMKANPIALTDQELCEILSQAI